jgi:ABC-type branched-subunit amino acid transport system ATPase component
VGVADAPPPVGGRRLRGPEQALRGLWALRDVDLDVPAGSVLGRLGHNGAGKTEGLHQALVAVPIGVGLVFSVGYLALRLRGRA